MGDRNFQLPGLGSYIQTATYAGDVRALLAGIVAVILIVVATDQLVWRPLIAWSDKFKFEQVESADRVTSPILELLRRSRLCQTLPGRIWNRVEEPDLSPHGANPGVPRGAAARRHASHAKSRRGFGRWPLAASWQSAGQPRRPCSCSGPSPGPTCACCSKAPPRHFCASMLRLLISAAWTIPVGVAIGFNPKLARIVQPLAQILASVPATAFFPILLIGLVQDRRRAGHRLDRADAAGHAVVHPLQRHRRRHVHPLRPARSRFALPLHALAALDQADPARHLSLTSSPAWSRPPAAHGTRR